MKNFPNWKKRDTVELCITILKKIKYLHARHIVLGDINPANILVVSPTEVYFVDTDSYQVEDFPCPVGTNNYTAPEIQRKHFSDFLRTMGNEYFAVATLLFMIMLPGKPPYSQQGGEDPINNIMKMDFSYPFGDNSNKKTPDGPWRYIWSHLTCDLKKAFYNTFRKGGDYSMDRNALVRVEDLVNNPTPRVPICLCLDTSGAMGALEGDYVQTGETMFKDGRLWNIATGGTSRIEELQQGVEEFYKAIREDEIAVYSAEICIVTFDSKAACLVDFANIERQDAIPHLHPEGDTAMGEGVNFALDLLEQRKQEYKDRGGGGGGLLSAMVGFND